MDLNSRDMWKPKLASYSKRFYSYFVSVIPQRFKTQTFCCEQCAVAEARRLQLDSTSSTEIHQTACQLSDGQAKEQVQSG